MVSLHLYHHTIKHDLSQKVFFDPVWRTSVIWPCFSFYAFQRLDSGFQQFMRSGISKPPTFPCVLFGWASTFCQLGKLPFSRWLSFCWPTTYLYICPQVFLGDNFYLVSSLLFSLQPTRRVGGNLFELDGYPAHAFVLQWRGSSEALARSVKDNPG